MVVVKAADEQHHHQAADGKTDLFIEIGVLATALGFLECEHRGCAVDHHCSEQGECSGNAKHQPVYAFLLRHYFATSIALLFKFPTAALNTSPRSSKLRNISKLAHAGASNT